MRTPTLSEGPLPLPSLKPRASRRAPGLAPGALCPGPKFGAKGSPPEPPSADEFLTHTLKSALALIDVRVLDHLIVGGRVVCSLAEGGMV